MEFNANSYRFEPRSLNAHTKKKKAIPVGMTFLFGGDYGTRTCDLMRVKHHGALPRGKTL